MVSNTEQRGENFIEPQLLVSSSKKWNFEVGGNMIIQFVSNNMSNQRSSPPDTFTHLNP